MLYLERMARREITGANYITSVNGMLHPDRILTEHDFLYILDGEWEILEDGKRYEVRTDDLLILASGRHHWGEKQCNPGNRHMYVHVMPTAREQAGGPDMDNLEEPLFLCDSILHCRQKPRIRQYFQKLISVYWSQDEMRGDRLTLYFNLLLCELMELGAEGPDVFSTDLMLEQVRQQIYSNPQRFYQAAEMAEQFYICPRTLNNHFRRACGKTFYAYQMELKLGMVREFLQSQPDAKLREAAVNFGFCDEFHLSKAFKRLYGEPPSRLRGSAEPSGESPSGLRGHAEPSGESPSGLRGHAEPSREPPSGLRGSAESSGEPPDSGAV